MNKYYEYDHDINVITPKMGDNDDSYYWCEDYSPGWEEGDIVNRVLLSGILITDLAVILQGVPLCTR